MPKKTEEKPSEFAPLAVVGLGGVFPKAKSLRRYWANVKNKVDAIQDVPASHWSKDDYFDADPKKPDMVYAYKGGFLDAYDFDPSEFGLAPNTLEATDPAQLFGLVAAKMALADAGYPVEENAWDRTRVSCILGVTGTLEIVIPLGARLSHPAWKRALADAGVPKEQADDAVARMSDQFVPWQEASFPGLLGNVVAGRIANRFNLGGTNCVVDAACGSSLAALHMAALELQSGRASMVVTGGVDAFNDIFMYTCFTKTPALSPSGHARPFDAKADGTTLGEGVGMVVLKRLDDARRDGDRIHAILRGLGSSSDGRGKSIYAPSAGGQTRALEEAYRLSGISPDTVELVEAHGTGTAVGDGIEVSALTDVYKRNTKRESAWCALGSVKSMIGHTKSAAGAAAFVKASMALRHKVFPPTLKVTEPLPILASGETPFYLSLEKRPWMAPEGHPRRAACSALGFGGTNFHAVLEEADSAKTETDWDGDHEILAFSGRDAAELSAKLAPWTAEKEWDRVRLDARAARAAFDASAPCRLTIVVEREGADAASLAKKAADRIASNGVQAAWTSPEGIYFGSGAAAKAAALFPGQGAQYAGMSRDLACAFPEAFGALAEADAAFDDGRLTDRMIPRPDWRAERREAQEKDLRDTSVAQPALGAASLAAWRVLARFGFKADAAAGHSYGELVALHAAGRYGAGTLHALSRLRGKLMKGDGSDKGSMLALVASLADAESFVSSEKLDLVIANRNAPTQMVLSGATAEIERAATAAAARGLKAVRLPVAAAFHSALVAPALKPFGAELSKTKFAQPSLPVYANSTGSPYPESESAARTVLAEQLGKPVEFVKTIEAMHADGIRLFVEIGAGARLTGLVGQILKGKDHAAISVDASNGKKNGVGDLARVLAQCAALGLTIDLSDWQGGEAGLKDARPKPKMSVTLTGATYRSTPKKNFPKRAPTASTASTAPQVPATAPALAAPLMTGDNGLLGAALAAAQSSIDALNKLQEQTAALHLQFLQSQDASQRHIQSLVEQQQAIYARMTGGTASLPAPVVAAPVAAAPVSVAPVAPARAHVAPTRAATAPAAAAPGTAVLPALLAIVSEKTGYPADTLNENMDLEGDLGIDSIKRVEILSAVREKLPGAPQVKPEHLGTLRTLKLIADYLSNGMNSSVAPVPAPAASIQAAAGHATAVLPALLAIVSEKTGYPAETLNENMDLEGDLGIDSIKRVEILSAVREKLPNAPQVKPEHLGTLRTLKLIADYLSNGMNSSAAPIPVPAAPVQAAAASGTSVLAALLAIVSEKTGYPAETLNENMDLEGDLGIDSIKRVEILSAVREKLPNAPQVKPEHLGTLRTLKLMADYLSQGAPAPAAAPAPAVPTAASAEEPMGRVVRSVPTLVPVGPRDAFPLKGIVIAVAKDSGLDEALARELRGKGLDASVVPMNPAELPAELGALVLIAPARPSGSITPWSAESEAWLKKAFVLTQAAGARFAKNGTRGLIATVTRLDGALGFDGAPGQDPALGGMAGLMKTAAREWPKVACRAIDLDPSLPLDTAAAILAKELGHEGPVETALTATSARTVALEERVHNPNGADPLKPGDAVIVTGGARGVTADCALALARAFRPKLVLVGRSPMPAVEAPDLVSARTESDLRRAISARDKSLAPKAVGEKAKEVLAAREIRATLARLSEAGAEARYRACDARDAAAVKALVAETVRDFGPIRGLVHGAGVLADKAILDKTPESVDAVLDTKLAGLRNFLGALDLPALRLVTLFSSSTARYGRVGQSDYAIANEALNKIARSLAKSLPACRVNAIGWGPWDGGMVDAGLKKLFASEGVGAIPLADGAARLVAESRGGETETVVVAEAGPRRAATTLAFERELTLDDAPILKSHAFGGRAVVPLALSAEWLAHAALHGHPGMAFVGFDDLRVLKPIAVTPGASTTIAARAGAAEKRDGTLIVPAELVGADGAPRAVAKVVLAARRPKAPAAALSADGPKYAGGLERAYGRVLFHGPALRVIKSVDALGPDGFVVDAAPAPSPADWTKRPPRDRWLAEPAALDAAFQALILWTEQNMGAPSLPSFVARYRQYAERFPETGSRLVAKVVRRGETASAEIEFLDERGALVARAEGAESVAHAALVDAFRRNAPEAAAR